MPCSTSCCILSFPVYLFYALVFYVMKLWRPPKKYTVTSSEYLDASYIHESEFEDEKIKPDEVLSFEGSTKEGSSIYFEVVTHHKYSTAVVHLYEAGHEYFGEFSAKLGDDNSVINCGPLTLEMREPFRRWRVTFRGNLKDSVTNDDQFVTIGGWWKPTSDARHFYSNCKAAKFRSILMTNPFDLVGNVAKISKFLYSGVITQYGQLYLEVGIRDNLVQHRFRGVRERTSKTFPESSEELHAYFTNGNRVSYKKSSVDRHTLTLEHGYITRADHFVRSLELSNSTQAMDTEHRGLIDLIDSSNAPFGIRKDVTVSSVSYVRSDAKVVTIRRVKVNNGLSTAIALFKTIRESTREVPIPQFDTAPEYHASTTEKLQKVLPFHHRACQDKSLTGGKGANLSRLLAIENDFTVPSGVVVTTAEYQHFLNSNPKIKKLIEELGVTGKETEHYVAIGEQIQKSLLESSTSLVSLKAYSQFNVGKFAVRSSALGEDGSDLSSAGQLESVLNVEPEKIDKSILECWSSNFRREVITYRRTHGQILNPAMAVVVQKMVTDGVAGVMFTCDPVRNDDSRIVINAVRGLGEQIVSGTTTPDEISVWKKNGKVDKPSKCCLDTDSIDHLVRVGTFLEKTFGRAQDVEFVVKDGVVHLVQSRDVTGRDRESHFELLTEFDDATLTDHEIYTTANVGEVAPYPFTPLERSTIFDQYDKTMADLSLREVCGYVPRHYHLGFHMTAQRTFIGAGELFLRLYEVFKKDRLAEFTIAGCELFNESMFKQASERYPKLSKIFPLQRMIQMLRVLFISSYRCLVDIKIHADKMVKIIPTSDASFQQLAEIQLEQRKLYGEVIRCHSEESMFSSFTYILVGMLIRGSEEGGMDPSMISDIANVFSNSSATVISADVPSSLKKLARAIVADGLVEEFCSKDGREAMRILEKGKTSGPMMQQFLQVHGHRGLKELYLKTSSWSEQPEMLVHTVKMMASSPDDEGILISPSKIDLVDTLKCKPKGLRKFMMKYMIKQTHRGVASREQAKDHLVRSTWALRNTMRALGQKLYQEGFIAEKDLFYYLTIDEIKILFATRSPKLISRAMRRKQIKAEIDTFEFEHIYHTTPKPINLSLGNDLRTTMSMRGTTVCEGVVIARARVASSLDEAKLTEPGEILITRCTDICWSPFFPIIKGIVTEIGGLLSHGAVVAREYGLPSLIAVQHATQVFQTGDLVELNASKGTISKVEP